MRTRRSQSSSYSVSSSAEKHHSVLLHEAIDSLAIQQGDTVVDATLGGAGHARVIAEKLGPKGTLIGFDLDPEAITRAELRLKEVKPKVHLIQENFRNLAKELMRLGIKEVHKALFDLGWSAYQLEAGRGFSFLSDEPLQMTYGEAKNSSLTAYTIVNTWGESSLADVIYGWGEERYSRRIAKGIVEARVKEPIKTARQLAEIIRSAAPIAYARGRIHPATRTFQALRIAVNDELGALEEGIKVAWSMLAPKGRIAVISFHSIEDRIVKRQFAEWEKLELGIRINKKPIVPSEEELAENPRARSAKLRIIEKN